MKIIGMLEFQKIDFKPFYVIEVTRAHLLTSCTGAYFRCRINYLNTFMIFLTLALNIEFSKAAK